MLFCHFTSSPLLPVIALPYPILWMPNCPGIFRGPAVHVASCEGETLRTLHTKGPQLAGPVLPWQPRFGNTSQAVCCELGKDCSFGNHRPRQLLAGRPLCELEQEPPGEGSEVLLGGTWSRRGWLGFCEFTSQDQQTSYSSFRRTG